MARRALVLVLAGFVLGACGGGDDGPTVTTTAAPTTTVAPTTTTLADLAPLLLRTPPRPGFTAITGVHGPFTLERYLRDFSSDPNAERTVLSTAGFVRGESRGWADKATRPTALAVFLFEFREGADLVPVRDQLLGQGRGDVRFDVPSIRGAVGVSSFVATASGRERLHRIGFVRGPRIVLVGAQHANVQAPTDVVVDVAAAQAALVP